MAVTHLSHFVQVLCICDGIRQLYECNQLHRYIVCVVVVIVCKKMGTRHTDRDDMQFNAVFFVALISVNNI